MNLVHDLLRATAARQARRTALVEQHRRMSFGSLDTLSDALAAALQQWGVRRGDRVAILLPNCVELPIAIFAALKAGAVFVVLNPSASPAKAAFMLRDCGAGVLIASAELASTVAGIRAIAPDPPRVIWSGSESVAAPPAAAPGDGALADALAHAGVPRDPGLIDQDLCTIIYTSGTTGEPKGVMMTHRNVVNTTGAIQAYLRLTPDDTVVCVLPMAFSYGLCQVFGAAAVGYTLLVERSFTFPYDVLRRAQEHRATVLPALPTVFARLVQLAPFDGLDLSSLRCMTNAAAPLPVAHIRRLREVFPRVEFFSMYGQTECTRACYLDPALIDRHPDAVGRAIPNCQAYVIGDDGLRAPPGTVGELVVRGANVMRGYWGRPDATEEKLRDGEIQGEKVLHTGDLFRTDSDGLLYFVGRTDDVFKCRGEKVSPREIEEVLCELPQVAEAAVVGVPDPIDGQAVKAVVVPREGQPVSEQDIRRHCKSRLDAGLMPKFVEVRSSLPRTDAGKLNRAALRAGPVQ